VHRVEGPKGLESDRGIDRAGGTIIVAGSLAQRPRIGGHTWVFLQYLLGFQRLGWDVLFLDRIEPVLLSVMVFS
jgi:hypothetical protein